MKNLRLGLLQMKVVLRLERVLCLFVVLLLVGAAQAGIYHVKAPVAARAQAAPAMRQPEADPAMQRERRVMSSDIGVSPPATSKYQLFVISL